VQPGRIRDVILGLERLRPGARDVLKSIASEAESLQQELRAAPRTIAWDLVCFRVAQLLHTCLGLSPLELRPWDSFWAATSSSHGLYTNQVYDPPRVYSTMLQFPEVFDKLRDAYLELLETSGTQLREDFLKIFFRVRASLIPQLSPGELRVFRLALKMQSLSPGTLASEIGTTKGYVSRIVSGLRRKSMLWEVVRFSYKALGLQVLIVMIELNDLDAELPVPFTRENPWLYSIFDSRMGTRFAIAHFIVPRSWRSQSEARAWADKLLEYEQVTNARVFQRDESACWRHYNYEPFDGQKWQVTSGLYGPMLRAAFKEPAQPLETQALEPDLHSFSLDSIDIQIIDVLLQEGPLTIRALRKKLRRDYGLVYKRYTTLKKRNIITTRVIPSPFLAPGLIVIMAKVDNDDHRRLCNAFKCLPEVYAERTTEEYSVFTLRVPEEHIRTVVDDVNDIMVGRDRWMTYHGNMHFVSWRLPIDRWMESYKEWRIDENDFGGPD